MSKIESLSNAQKELVSNSLDKWKKVAISTTPANRGVAEQAFTKLYSLSGLEKPKFIWEPSPMTMMKNLKSNTENLETAVFDIEGETFFKMRKSVQDESGDFLGKEAFEYIQVQYRTPLFDFCRNNIEKHIKNEINIRLGFVDVDYNVGQYHAFMVGHFELLQELGLKISDKNLEMIKAWETLAHNVGFFMWFKGLCIVCEKASVVEVVDDNINCENGPAIAFEDGLEVYAINGHVVPKKVIMTPELITLKEIKDEKNAETKRIMCERYGMGKYLIDIGAKVVDIDASNSFRSLMEDNEGNKFLEGTDGSTKRIYFMPVPTSVKTCKEAHEAICGISEDMILMQS